MLDEAVQNGNPDVRKEPAEALSLVGANDKLLGSLGALLDDHDVAVRTAAVASLGDFRDSTTVPLLKKALEDPVPEVDFAAAKALYQLHEPEGEQFLVEVVTGESKASSSYVIREERKAAHLLHTPPKLFTTAAINAAGSVPVPGSGSRPVVSARHPFRPGFFRPRHGSPLDRKHAQCGGGRRGPAGVVGQRMVGARGRYSGGRDTSVSGVPLGLERFAR